MSNDSRPDSGPDTRKHINRVRELLGQVQSALKQRAEEHDASKLEPYEKPYYDDAMSLWGMTYNSPEYKAALARLGPALEHHYQVNRHHPEHYGIPDMGNPHGGIKGMNLLDLVEMLADWKAATERHADGNLARSIEVNATRFYYGEDMKRLLRETAAQLGWL
jgi:hypothetical protein